MTRLATCPQWVAWRWAGTKKPPIDPHTGQSAGVADPRTWGSLEQAETRARADSLPGVGIVITPELGIIGIDLDKVRDPDTGECEPWVAEILALGETYTERSPSGRGVRLFVEGHIPEDVVRSDLGVEIYGGASARYLTVTGGHINGTPYEIRPAPRTLALLLARAGVEIKVTSQGGEGQERARETPDNVWGRINRLALENIGAWWCDLFPNGYRSGRSWRAGLKGRGLEEDVAATPQGIKDWGVHDMDDPKEGRRSPIELVIEHGAAPNAARAALWLLRRLGIEPASIGWMDEAAGPGEDLQPTYPARERPVEEVRAELESHVESFFQSADHHHQLMAQEPRPSLLGISHTPPAAPVHGIRTSTGTGKTETVARLYARHRREAEKGAILASRPLLQLVPTHRLGEETAAKYEVHGLTAKVWRGREADDPDHPGRKMCLDLEAVRVAEKLGEPIERAVCQGKDPGGVAVECPFYRDCAYQRQKDHQPDVWIAAHQIAFHLQPAFGEVAAIVMDEAFWQSAIRNPTGGISVHELREAPFRPGREVADADVAEHRARLARAIDRHQGQPGGLRREHLVAEGITVELCTEALKLEYALKPDSLLWPGMSRAERERVGKGERGARHVLARVAVWRAVRDTLEVGAEVSGRVFLDVKETKHGRLLVVCVLGLYHVATSWADLPTLILDATLPSLEVLRVFYPAVEIVADLEASMPFAIVRQVLAAPTAAGKLAKGDESGRNVRDLRRYVLKRWLQHGRCETLVIAQKEAAEKLRALGLPGTIHVEHFNNVAGLDRYKDARLLILAGRTLPGPDVVENFAGALTCAAPVRSAIAANGRPWYDRVTNGLRMADGSARPIPGDRHPDPVAEALRWQICEGELVQALGRVRGVNRTADNPVRIDILADVALPVTVTEAVAWEEVMKGVGGWCETAVEGVILTSPADMAKAFPKVWPSLRSAEREVADFPANSLYRNLPKDFGGEMAGLSEPPWLVTLYQPAGRGQQRRTALFDLGLIPQPRTWLEARVGPLKEPSREEPEERTEGEVRGTGS